jgi:WD40 repeat protein
MSAHCAEEPSTVDIHHGPAFAGDSTVKLWSFEKQRCVATLSDHKQAVWGVKYHDQGDWLASCSLDHSIRSGLTFVQYSTACTYPAPAHIDLGR